MMSNYIYLLQPLLSITNNENVFKIGKTHRKNLIRFSEYQNGSNLLLQRTCIDCDIMEKILLKIFCEKFKKRTDYGIEYFYGDYKEMIKIINYEIDNENINDENINVENIENDENIEHEKDEEKNKKFNCIKCNFHCNKNSNYNKHLLTSKHLKKNITKTKILKCENCYKEYKSRSALWYHKDKCKNLNINNTNNNLIMNMIKQNTEFQKQIIDLLSKK